MSYTVDYLIEHCRTSIVNAYNNKSKLPNEIYNINGMTGDKTRRLYNNMCDLSGIHYLEIGTWIGSSFCSAMYKNNIKGTCIDNWSEFDFNNNGGPYKVLCNNINKFAPTQDTTIIQKDCWLINKNDITIPIDIYLYDGAHDYDSQKKAITYYHQFFSKYVIIMIDDWVFGEDIKKGTIDGMVEMKMKLHFAYEIGLVNCPDLNYRGNTFWNGCGIFVCERTDI
jgi:hypothetical protein